MISFLLRANLCSAANMSKLSEIAAHGHEVPDHASDDVVLGTKQGTSKDVEDMKRMGKEQLFQVILYIPSITIGPY